MKTIIESKCGGKKGGCCVEYELPYGVAPKRISDNPRPQIQAGDKKPKPKKETE